MFIKFANDKCPICGNGGNAIAERLFKCGRCDVAYDRFSIFGEPRGDGEHWS
ncbi:MAG: hypothetical protein HY365_03770 [Candidatus Aenigmarchaeota archaeon]|nr:hypothetical protein [Candidatus Aenigmarchaeota archaeon]